MLYPAYKNKTGAFPVRAQGGSPQMVELWNDSNSFQHLKCLCPDFQMKSWCKHIEEVYTDPDDIDAKSIVSTTAVQIFKEPKPLYVPVLVLMSSVTSSAPRVRSVGGVLEKPGTGSQISEPVDTSGYGEVIVVFGDVRNTSATNISAAGQYSLGFIKKDVHGRRTLRRLIFEWLAAIPYVFRDQMGCGDSAHVDTTNYFDFDGDETALALEQPNETLRQSWKFRDAFTLLDTGSCYTCAESKRLQVD